MNSLRDFNFSGKKVLVRCDFNVPIKEGQVVDDFKIQRTLDTLNYLKSKGARLILISHLGRPNQNKKLKIKNKKYYSLKPVAEKLSQLLKEKVKFIASCLGRRAKREAEKLKPGEILLLENLRFEKGEIENDEKFAKKLAELGEAYVSEAFAVCHRRQASVVHLPKLLPHFAGLNLQKEVEVLSQISQNPQPPLVVVIGGVKIESKIEVIEKFLKTCDHLLFGGKIANMILRVKGICIGKPWPQEEIVKKIEKLNLTDPKVHLPVDVLASPDESGEVYVRETGPGTVRKDEEIFDIGKETIETFSGIIKNAKTIFWSGPLGRFETEKFSGGTREVARAIARTHGAFRVVGGGETIEAIKRFGLLDRFSFVSTGGGAMLSFLAGEELPGLRVLEE